MSAGKIGIAGAGIMGGEIAYIATQAGFPVVLKDIDRKFLDSALAKVRLIYESKVKRRRMSAEDMENCLSRITMSLDYAAFEDVDFVIEAVPEDLSIKQRVFSELEAACPGNAVLTSNTSALSITAISEKASHPERIAGMHFFNPVSLMRLVEVIRGKNTSDDTVAKVISVVETMGKAPVSCADSAGFIVNRLLCAAMVEAVRCEDEGILPRAAIDNVLVKPDAGLPVGLFRMADQLGIDLLYKVMKILEASFGPRLAPPDAIKSLYESGKLGIKSGEGFYVHSGGNPPPPENIDPALKKLVIERVLTAVVAEARRLLAEGVASAPDIDTAMTYGALFKKPPFSYTAETGESAMNGRLKKFASLYGEQFAQ